MAGSPYFLKGIGLVLAFEDEGFDAEVAKALILSGGLDSDISRRAGLRADVARIKVPSVGGFDSIENELVVDKDTQFDGRSFLVAGSFQREAATDQDRRAQLYVAPGHADRAVVGIGMKHHATPRCPTDMLSAQFDSFPMPALAVMAVVTPMTTAFSGLTGRPALDNRRVEVGQEIPFYGRWRQRPPSERQARPQREFLNQPGAGRSAGGVPIKRCENPDARVGGIDDFISRKATENRWRLTAKGLKQSDGRVQPEWIKPKHVAGFEALRYRPASRQPIGLLWSRDSWRQRDPQRNAAHRDSHTDDNNADARCSNHPPLLTEAGV